MYLHIGGQNYLHVPAGSDRRLSSGLRAGCVGTCSVGGGGGGEFVSISQQHRRESSSHRIDISKKSIDIFDGVLATIFSSVRHLF